MCAATLGQLALRVQGELRGNADLEIRGAVALTKAGPHDISFAADEKHLRRLADSQAGACLVDRKYRESGLLDGVRQAILFVDDPHDGFISVLREFRAETARPIVGIS